MDQQYTGQPLLDLEVDSSVSRSFRETTRWAKFIGIYWAILLGIVLIVVIIGGPRLAEDLSFRLDELDSPYASIIANGLLFIAFGIVAVGVLTLFFLFRFCSHMKAGLERQDQALFISGLKSLKNYFTIFGIATILYFLLGLIAEIYVLFMLNVQ